MSDRYEEDEYTGGGWFGSTSSIVGVLAVIGFVALSWYAYQNSSTQMDPSQVELIEGLGGAMKEAPQDPGGWQAPHQDKSVYDAFSAGEESGAEVVERLTPAPEEPVEVPAEEVVSAASNKSEAWMSAKLSNAEESLVPLTDAEQRSESAPKAVSAVKEEAVILKKEAVEVPKTIEKAEPPVAPEPVKEVIKSLPKPAVTTSPVAPVASGSAKIQVGALKSEAEAKAHLARAKAKAGTLLNGFGTDIERADLGTKGVFWRAYITGFVSKDAAKDKCAELKARQVDCLVR